MASDTTTGILKARKLAHRIMSAPDYEQNALDRATLDRLPGPAVIDFGTPWCGYCNRARPLVDEVMARHPGVHHVRIEDAPGRRLGRSLAVKLWPTLVFWRGGRELARLVRPTDTAQIDAAVSALEAADD